MQANGRQLSCTYHLHPLADGPHHRPAIDLGLVALDRDVKRSIITTKRHHRKQGSMAFLVHCTVLQLLLHGQLVRFMPQRLVVDGRGLRLRLRPSAKLASRPPPNKFAVLQYSTNHVGYPE